MNHYQINLRSIANHAPRNPLEALAEAAAPATASVSPLKALTGGLEAIAGLGIDLLHIMPPFRMGLAARKGIGSPYAAADYQAIDPEFGSKSEWFDLVRRAHELGLSVIMGYVPNHTARDHVWVDQDSRFHLRDGPGQPSYDFDWSDTAKLDYTCPELRQAVTGMLCGWIRGEGEGTGVDGFRLDMAHMINDLSFWDEVIPVLGEAAGDRELLLLAECYGFDRNVDLFHRGMQAAYDDDFYKIAQYGFARDAGGHSRLVLDPAAAGNGDFAPRLADWHRGGIAAAVTGLIQAYQDHNHGRSNRNLLARYVDNHDEGRGVYRFGEDASRVMMDLAACLPDTLLFTLAGQEAGAWNRPPIHEYIQPCDKGYRRVTGDQVSYVPGVEFEGNLFFRTSEQRRQSVSDARKRFALRHEHPALLHGSWTPMDVGEQCPENERSVVAFTREFEGQTLHALFNLGHDLRELRTPPEGTLIYGQPGDHAIAPFGCRVLQA